MKLIKLVAALGLAAVSASSFAVVGYGSASGANGELLLSVWDAAGSKSYTFDTGVTTGSFLASSSTTPFSITLDSSYTTFLSTVADPSQLLWAVFGTNGSTKQFSTVTVGLETEADDGTGHSTTAGGDMLNQIGNESSYIQAVNGLGSHPLPGNGNAVAAGAGNTAYFGTSPQDGSSFLTFTNTNAIGVGAKIGYFTDVNDLAPATGVLQAGTLTFGQAGANFALSYSVPVAAVPEPGSIALVMAGFGVMGLVARRRKPNA